VYNVPEVPLGLGEFYSGKDCPNTFLCSDCHSTVMKTERGTAREHEYLRIDMSTEDILSKAEENMLCIGGAYVSLDDWLRGLTNDWQLDWKLEKAVWVIQRVYKAY